jgi:hypothetical protein
VTLLGALPLLLAVVRRGGLSLVHVGILSCVRVRIETYHPLRVIW